MSTQLAQSVQRSSFDGDALMLDSTNERSTAVWLDHIQSIGLIRLLLLQAAISSYFYKHMKWGIAHP
ncbi:hypothetical protein H6F86_17290 [Phormidium sp. FACHB-592]|uniref:Uncharacterized protein n=1 Tax=Stenomitos frigidus AS-A4 TaxID=2933935 RepID=A0ABV0KSJ7_9CYAN|nr:hypothetical protein [Phormidium sp. FACHB-592]MBD2075618.1 hypothetical protein [Phormidium sp. FACHB-592]